MGGDICTICCGTEREQTVHCPLECEYLQESRRHNTAPTMSLDDFPNKDIRVSEEFLETHRSLLFWLTVSLTRAALETPNVIDNDVKTALDALIKTYRTLQSGLIYESRPDNPIAGAIYERVQAAVEEYRKRLAEERGMSSVRDAEVLGILAFLQRLEIQFNNGRRLGRAFIDNLRTSFPVQPPESQQEPSIIL